MRKFASLAASALGCLLILTFLLAPILHWLTPAPPSTAKTEAEQGLDVLRHDVAAKNLLTDAELARATPRQLALVHACGMREAFEASERFGARAERLFEAHCANPDFVVALRDHGLPLVVAIGDYYWEGDDLFLEGQHAVDQAVKQAIDTARRLRLPSLAELRPEHVQEGWRGRLSYGLEFAQNAATRTFGAVRDWHLPDYQAWQPEALTPEERSGTAFHKIAHGGLSYCAQFDFFYVDGQPQVRRNAVNTVVEAAVQLGAGGIRNLNAKSNRGDDITGWDAAWAIADGFVVYKLAGGAVRVARGATVAAKAAPETGTMAKAVATGRTAPVAVAPVATASRAGLKSSLQGMSGVMRGAAERIVAAVPRARTFLTVLPRVALVTVGVGLVLDPQGTLAILRDVAAAVGVDLGLALTAAAAILALVLLVQFGFSFALFWTLRQVAYWALVWPLRMLPRLLKQPSPAA
jgi:hypothetical protein